MPVVICKECKVIGSDAQSAIFAGWLQVKILGKGVDKEYWLCDKCTKDPINVQFNVRRG